MYRVLLERAAEKIISVSRQGFTTNSSWPLEHSRTTTAARLPQTHWQQNDWRIRVGDYRVIYEIDDAIALCASFGCAIDGTSIGDGSDARGNEPRCTFQGRLTRRTGCGDTCPKRTDAGSNQDQNVSSMCRRR